MAGPATPRTRRSRAGNRSATGPGFGRALSFALGLTVLLGLAGCGPAPERFAGAFDSQRALVEEFLRALEARDRGRLEGLALTEAEFKTEAYPEMPASGKIPSELAWSQMATRSEAGLATVLGKYGGRAFALEDVMFRGAHTPYTTFVVHRRPMVRVRDRQTGEEKTLALFGSILECRGRFKLFSFSLDR